MSKGENREIAMRMGASYSERAYNKLNEAKHYTDQGSCFPEAVSSCQECIELSVKAIFLFTGVKYPKQHKFFEDNFKKVLTIIREKTEKMSPFDERPDLGVVERVFTFSMFWASMYEYAKYGIEKFGVGPEKIFKLSEAELALKHAYEAYDLARMLFDIFGGAYYERSQYKMVLRKPAFNLYDPS